MSVHVVVKPSVMRVTLIVCWGEVVGVLAGCCLSVCGGLIGMFQTCCSVVCGVSGLAVALVLLTRSVTLRRCWCGSGSMLT